MSPTPASRHGTDCLCGAVHCCVFGPNFHRADYASPFDLQPQRTFEIFDRGGEFVSVSIAKGETKDVVPEEKKPHYVDGISGATLTGKYLSVGIRDTLENYEPVSIRFRRNLVDEPPG